MRVVVVAAAISLAMVGLSLAEDAKASIRRPTNIPAQSLVPALKQLAHERGIQVVFQTEVVGAAQTHGAAGELSTAEALAQLLEGTNLVYRYLDDNTVTIVRLSGSSTSEGSAPAWPNTAPGSMPAASQQKEGKKDSSGAFLLAQVVEGAPASSSTVEKTSEQASTNKAVRLEEVIVTAQKREERLQDVPVPVAVINAATLVNSNQLRLQDYYNQIPGLSVTPNAQSNLILSIRGVTTGVGNPTVGVMVDDTPYGSSTFLGGAAIVPDIDPGDLARVEVLRGPQGTFYGASSMGGLLKFVTVDPSTAGVSGRVQGGLSSVYNGNELGYNVRASVNVPLSDTFAICASGFTRRDPGYVDNPVLRIDGVNRAKADGGRLSALWRPSDVMSLKLTALLQEIKGDGSSDVRPALGDLQQSNLRGTGEYDRKAQAYTATLSAKLGRMDLTAVSGYSVNAYSDSFDITHILAGLTQAFFGVPGTPLTDDNKTKKFTQEVRLTVPIGQRVAWLFGAFYTDEDTQSTQSILAADPATGVEVGSGIHSTFPTTYREYAAFTDLTLNFTDRFDVQVGGRESEIRQTYTQTYTGIYTPIFNGGAPSPFVIPKVSTKANAFTYLLTPRFKLSSSLMVYARLASGYRAGGPNAAIGVPPQYDPDKTQNYELGVKGDVRDHSLSLDASVYYIDWKDIQLTLLNPQTFQSYNANASRAKSQGVEFSIESSPLRGLTLAAWAVWDDAELTEALPPAAVLAGTYGVPGDRLPYSSRFSGNFSVDQEFALSNSVTGFAGGMVSYVGDRKGVFLGTPQRQSFPAYAKTDLRAGLRHDSWTVKLFVANVTDKRGVLYGGLGAQPPYGFTYIQPRTVGLNLEKTF